MSRALKVNESREPSLAAKQRTLSDVKMQLSLYYHWFNPKSEFEFRKADVISLISVHCH
jgi:hypothetical protein